MASTIHRTLIRGGGGNGPVLQAVAGLAIDATGQLHVSSGGTVEVFALGGGGAVAAQHVRTARGGGGGGAGLLAAPRRRSAPSAKLSIKRAAAAADAADAITAVDAFGHAVGANSGSSVTGGSDSGPFDVEIEWDTPVLGFTEHGLIVGGTCGGVVTDFRPASPDGRKVGRCWLTVIEAVLKSHMVSALEARI